MNTKKMLQPRATRFCSGSRRWNHPLFIALFLIAAAVIVPASGFADDTFRHLREGVKRIQLENGLRILLYRRPSPGVFAGQVWVKVGGVNESPGITGIAHFLEHMAFKGTDRIGTKNYEREKVLLPRFEELTRAKGLGEKVDEKELEALRSELDSIWVQNEFSKLYLERGAQGINAATAKDYTYYTVELPAVALEFWCWMESERLLHPVFRQFSREREVVLEERRSRFEDNPDGKLYEALLSTAYVVHPNRLPVIGLVPDLRSLRVDDVMRFRNTYYRPDNIVLTLVGDIDPAVAEPLLKRYFGRLEPSATPLPEVAEVEPPQRQERTVEVHFDSEPALIMGFHKPVYPNPDDADFAVLHSILSGGRSSVLYDELVQQKQLSVGVGTGEGPGMLYPNLFMVQGTPKRGVSNAQLRDEVQAILDRYKHTLVSNELLSAAKRRVRVSYLDDLASNSGLAEALGESELLYHDWTAIFEIYERILRTTAEDIRRIANAYLSVNNRTYAHLEKRSGAAKKSRSKQKR